MNSYLKAGDRVKAARVGTVQRLDDNNDAFVKWDTGQYTYINEGHLELVLKEPIADQIDPDVQRVWEEFWLKIVVKDGYIGLNEIKKELFDYATLLDEVPKVYATVTRGRISKPNTLADAVISEYNDVNEKELKEEIEEAMAYRDEDNHKIIEDFLKWMVERELSKEQAPGQIDMFLEERRKERESKYDKYSQ
jgi:hypothetical protein